VTYRSFPPAIGLLVAIGLAIPVLAEAQGNGRPKAPKAPTSTTTTSTSTSSPSTTSPVAVTTFRQFGAWLDDASAPTRGEGYTSIGVGHWRMSGMTQTNVPMLGVGVGVTDRLQASMSVPFYHASFEGGTASGLDDIYLGAKYTILDPTLTLSEFGLAVSPVVEVLGQESPDGRVHFGLPVSMELRRQPVRVYGSVGYFTRGSFFSGGALEWTMASGMVLTGSLTQSYSLKEDATLDALAIGRQRADVSFGMAYPVASIAAAYVNVGRSLTSLDEGGARLAVSGGVSLRFNTGSKPWSPPTR